MTPTAETARFLLCRIGACIGALALEDVRETLRPLPIEPLAGAPSFVLGLTLLRGLPTPVVDMARLIGPVAQSADSPPSQLSPRPLARFVAVKLAERTVALAVDAVIEVRVLSTEVLAGIPPLLGAGTEGVSLVGALDAKLLLVLEAARLIPLSVWSTIESPGTAA